MLPLTHHDHRSLVFRAKTKINDWIRIILADRNSRNLLLFLLLNFSFAFVELFYGIATNSLGKCAFSLQNLQFRPFQYLSNRRHNFD